MFLNIVNHFYFTTEVVLTCGGKHQAKPALLGEVRFGE